MAQATVKTVQYLDPRIEPQPDPVYDYVIAPTQNQFYRIPASGLSDSNITFNNLTTLGVDRAYLDTFELEISATITFELDTQNSTKTILTTDTTLIPGPGEWTFQSFPFNTCCDEARVNINGGAFFSQPMCYLRAKERYMSQKALQDSYANICPCQRPELQTESGISYERDYPYSEQMTTEAFLRYLNGDRNEYHTDLANYNSSNKTHGLYGTMMGTLPPTRYGGGRVGYYQNCLTGPKGSFNNSIVKNGGIITSKTGLVLGDKNYYREGNKTFVNVTWREPLFVSPFSSRYDADYGRPLYNITSMDLSFNLQNLGNMIRVKNMYHADMTTDGSVPSAATYVKNYSVHISACNLCYQVMTIPAQIQKPLTTLVPYRRFVPYITDFNQRGTLSLESNPYDTIDTKGVDDITLVSGVYTFNEIPTAIWVFVAPSKSDYQTNEPDDYAWLEGDDASDNPANSLNHWGNWDTNKLFGFIKHVNISLANTTQILNTAQVEDLYRIAKANGCEDSYLSWAGDKVAVPSEGSIYTVTTDGRAAPYFMRNVLGAGSVLRLKPGVDLVVPDIPLVPGANANSMVFQCEVKCNIPPHSRKHAKYALWLLFEYVGVAAISPGQCEITMNPLGSGEIMGISPVMSATSETTEGAVEGSGFWDNAKKGTKIAAQIASSGVISRILKMIPGAQQAAKWAEDHLENEPAAKRGRGGAVIGHGLNEWV